jgi:RNA polymerase sigma-70 factor (ECF subfamily)
MTEIAQRLYERVLVLRCQAGDEAAFGEIVERYSPRLRYYLRKMLGKAHDADDVLQEVWFDVLRGISRLSEPGAFPAWLYRVARDRAFRQLRRRRPPDRPLEEADLATEGGGGGGGAGGDDGDFSAEDAERVHAALDRVVPEHREVLLLRFVEGMAYEDIARVTGCRLGTVRSRLHYAKRALRRILEEENVDERERAGQEPPETRRDRSLGRP